MQVDEFVGGDVCGRGGGDAILGSGGGVEDAGGLALAVTGDEGFLFGGTDATGEFGGQVGLDVEGGIVEEFLADLEEGAELVGRQGQLDELRVGLGVGAAFVEPGRGAVCGDDGDLAVLGSGLDDAGQWADDVLVGHGLHEGAFELVGDEVVALSVDALGQGVADLGRGGVESHRVPERLLVGVGGAMIRRCGFGFGVSGYGCQRGGGVAALGPLGAEDLVGEGVDVGFHAGVGGVVFGRQDAVGVAVVVKEGLGGLRACQVVCVNGWV